MLTAQAAEVLRRFALKGEPVFQGNRGGFSGARLWRIRLGAETLCLRAWPPAMHVATLKRIHALLDRARQAGLDFVPILLPTHDGDSMTTAAGRLWELTTWLPGRADFHAQPSDVRLQNACCAVARLHAAWDAGSVAGPCPAVGRRLDQARQFLALMKAGWRPEAPADPSLAFWTAAAWRATQRLLADVPAQLTPWTDVVVELQPCFCDLWHDHVLFTGEAVTGLVDFGSVKTDHVAVDLARLLGSLVADDASLRAIGLAAYEEIHPLTAQERQLVEMLDRTGTVVGAANWLRWLFHEHRAYEDLVGVTRRLQALVTRMERW